MNTNTRSSQTKDQVLAYIKRHRLTQGSQLPSEAEIAKTIGVSRNTVREAYITLEAEGIIIRRHGIGTFVARDPIIKESLVGEVSGFISRIQASGYTPSFRQLSTTQERAPLDVSEGLEASPAELLLCVKRVLVADETPAVYLIDYFAPGINQSDFDWDSFDGNLIALVTKSLGISDRQMHSRILAVITDQEIAACLELPQGQPIIEVVSTITTLDNAPLGYSIVYINPYILELDTTRLIRGT